MVKKLLTGQNLNPVLISDNFEWAAERKIMVIGGWEQNPDCLLRFQYELSARNIASIAFSGFDLIDPTMPDEEASADEKVAACMTGDELLADIPPRMILRALLLLEMSEKLIAANSMVIDDTNRFVYDWPQTVVTHCAGANVYLLAHYIDRLQRPVGILPQSAILLEPMLASGRTAMEIAKLNGKHEKRALDDPEYISLSALRHSEAVKLGFAGKLPMGDIIGTSGTKLLAAHQQNGGALRIVLGHEDVAAPESIVLEILADGLDIQVTHYPIEDAKQKYGHGFLFAEPGIAADVVGTML